MQVVFQDPFASLSPRMTIGQIVGEGLALHQPELDKAAREQRVLEMLEEVGLSERHGVAGVLQRYPHEFSGGQRQRIAIARAIILKPDLIVLDEPTSALDMQSEALVHQTLANLKGKVTLVLIAHRMSTLNICDRIIVLGDGKLQAFDQRERLETENVFYREALELSRMQGHAAKPD